MIQRYEQFAHYDFYAALCNQYEGWHPMPPDCLPPTGWVYYLNGFPAAFVFMYECLGTRMVIMEWLIVDKKLTKDERHEAIEGVIKAATDHANANNYIVFTYTKSAKLMHRYLNAGFIKTDEGMTNFIYRGQ